MVLRFLYGAGGGFQCLCCTEGDILVVSQYMVTRSGHQSCREGKQGLTLAPWHPLQEPKGGSAWVWSSMGLLAFATESWSGMAASQAAPHQLGDSPAGASCQPDRCSLRHKVLPVYSP